MLHPFASAPEKRWPTDKFCELARYLKLWNLEPVFLAAPGDDREPFSTHRVFSGSLADAKALVAKASLICWERQRAGAHGRSVRYPERSSVRLIETGNLGTLEDGIRDCCSAGWA